MPKTNLKTFETTLDENYLKNIFQKIQPVHEDVILTLPKFKLTKKINLKSAFTKLGLSIKIYYDFRSAELPTVFCDCELIMRKKYRPRFFHENSYNFFFSGILFCYLMYQLVTINR